MTPFDLYRNYLGLKLHFETDYRYDKSGPGKASYETFESRPDRLQFNLLADKSIPAWRLLSNLALRNCYIRDINSGEAGEIALESLGRLESISRVLRAEVPLLKAGFFRSSPGRHPDLARAIMSKRVSRETGAILLGMTQTWRDWERDYSLDPVMTGLNRRLFRYFVLLPFDQKKVKEVLSELLS